LHKTPLIHKWFWPRRDVHLTMRIEINYQAETLGTAVCEAIVTYHAVSWATDRPGGFSKPISGYSKKYSQPIRRSWK
jgi:hypothetical protein